MYTGEIFCEENVFMNFMIILFGQICFAKIIFLSRLISRELIFAKINVQLVNHLQ